MRRNLREKVEAAKLHVEAAETELNQLMKEIRAEPRSRKTTLSEVMQSAFDKLRAAQSDVATLEQLLKSNDE